MKYTEPVTIDDLEATAKDDKHGTTLYRYLKVYSDDATNTFNYWYKGSPVSRMAADGYLKSLERKS